MHARKQLNAEQYVCRQHFESLGESRCRRLSGTAYPAGHDHDEHVSGRNTAHSQELAAPATTQGPNESNGLLAALRLAAADATRSYRVSFPANLIEQQSRRSTAGITSTRTHRPNASVPKDIYAAPATPSFGQATCFTVEQSAMRCATRLQIVANPGKSTLRGAYPAQCYQPTSA